MLHSSTASSSQSYLPVIFRLLLYTLSSGSTELTSHNIYINTIHEHESKPAHMQRNCTVQCKNQALLHCKQTLVHMQADVTQIIVHI